MSLKIGFVGLGAIGAGMARNLVRADHDVLGLDVSEHARAQVARSGITLVDSPAAVARGVDLLLITVFSAGQAELVLFGEDGALASLPEGAVVVMHTTMSPQHAQALALRVQASGHRYLDAPVTGGKAGADAGTLTVIVSGDEKALHLARPALEAMGSKVAVCGSEVGQASTVKMANQVLCGIQVAAAAEALALATRAGADPNVVYEVLVSGSANSVVWQTRVPNILAGDYTPRGVVDIFKKDLGIALDAARLLDMPTPLASVALQQFLAAAAMGYGQADNAAIVKVYEQLAGIDIAAIAAGKKPSKKK